jgi:hypothetical protein
MICKAYLDGKWYAMDSLDPVVWEYSEYRKGIHDYNFPE